MIWYVRVISLSGMRRGERVHERAPWVSVGRSKLVGDLFHWFLPLYSSRCGEKKGRQGFGRRERIKEKKVEVEVFLVLPKGERV